MDHILYEIQDKLYINLTNRCPCSCVFCIRQKREDVHGSGTLWLTREPSVEEVKAELGRFAMDRYHEVVFCGFGEPTERLYELLEIAEFVKKEYKKPVRANTNGLSNLIYGTDTAPLFRGTVDSVSVSLVAPGKERYYELTGNKFGLQAYDELISFVKNIRRYVPEVIVTTIDTVLSKEEEEECADLCRRLEVSYRIRKFESGG